MKHLTMILCLPALALATACTQERGDQQDGMQDDGTTTDGTMVVPEETPSTNGQGTAGTMDGSAGRDGAENPDDAMSGSTMGNGTSTGGSQTGTSSSGTGTGTGTGTTGSGGNDRAGSSNGTNTDRNTPPR